MTEPRPLVVPITETALLLSMSERAVLDAMRRGTLPCVRIGRRRMFPLAWLSRQVEAALEAAAAKTPEAKLRRLRSALPSRGRRNRSKP